jgi:hypothetical protein
LNPSIKSKLGIGLGAIALALLLAAAPEMETDIEVNARMQAEAAAMRAAQPKPEPCWDELPFRVALTQENIDRLCIKVQRSRPVALRSVTSATPTTPKETP